MLPGTDIHEVRGQDLPKKNIRLCTALRSVHNLDLWSRTLFVLLIRKIPFRVLQLQWFEPLRGLEL